MILETTILPGLEDKINVNERSIFLGDFAYKVMKKKISNHNKIEKEKD